MKNVPPTRFGLSARLTEELNGAHKRNGALVLAASDPAGQPLLSYRGSAQVFSDHQVGLWIRNSVSTTLDAIAQNPRVALIYRSETLPMVLLEGEARIAREGERTRVYDMSPEGERAQDPGRTGIAVIIDLTKIDAVLGFSASGMERETFERPLSESAL